MKTIEQTTEEILGLAAQYYKIPREELMRRARVPIERMLAVK